MVQLEELLRVLEQSHADHPDLARSREVKAEANKVVKLADSLYSPIQESQQYEAIAKRMEVVMEREVDQLFQEMVQENLERMVTRSVKACPSFLDDGVCVSLNIHLHSYINPLFSFLFLRPLSLSHFLLPLLHNVPLYSSTCVIVYVFRRGRLSVTWGLVSLRMSKIIQRKP